jgi:iron complex transport system substrate-binding protein
VKTTIERPGITLPEVEDITRRDFLVGGAAALLLAGCGSGGEGGSGGGTTSAASGTRTIEHKFGSTEVGGSPERVVSIGYQEHDFLYALGVSPVAVRYWYGDEEDVVRSWAEDEAGDANPEVLNMPEGLNFERIAALDPDLIVGLYSGMTRDDYETLSEIAPTIAQSGDYIDYGMPWQETTVMLGRAIGREARAEELVAEVEGQFEEAREAHPEFEGKSLAVATYSGDTFGVFAAEDARSRFFTSLGFVVPEEFTELAGDSFYADLSVERLDLLETDVLVWDQLSFTEGGRETIETEPLIRRLDVMQDGRAIFLEGAVEDAFGWNTVLSIPFALKEIVPMLERAVEDPTEETTG